MPSLFQGRCDPCGYVTPIVTSEYGAVWEDEPVASEQSEVLGAVLHSDADPGFSQVRDPRFVVLAHPNETGCLASTGHTWGDVLWQGRYVVVKNVVCGNCGSVFQVRSLASPGFLGCYYSLVAGVIAGIGSGIAYRSFVLGFIVWQGTTLAVAFAFELAERLYVRWRFANRAAALADERFCPHCHACDYKPINRGVATKCPGCAQDTLKFEIVGIS